MIFALYSVTARFYFRYCSSSPCWAVGCSEGDWETHHWTQCVVPGSWRGTCIHGLKNVEHPSWNVYNPNGKPKDIKYFFLPHRQPWALPALSPWRWWRQACLRRMPGKGSGCMTNMAYWCRSGMRFFSGFKFMIQEGYLLHVQLLFVSIPAHTCISDK